MSRIDIGVVHEARGLRRLTGLMGRRDVSGIQLWFPRCASVHTFFMRARIDVVFLDHLRHVVKVVENVAAWRMLFGGPHADSALEFRAGCARMYGMNEGDQIEWQSD